MDVEKAIIFDSREQQHHHYTEKLSAMGYELRREKLDAGDITFIYGGKDYRGEWICERKKNLNELFSNIVGKDRKRIKAEFKRLLSVSVVILLIEEKSREIALMHLKKRNYKMNTHSFPIKFDTFLKYRNYERSQVGMPPIKVVYCERSKTAETILGLINEYLIDINQQKSKPMP